MKKLALITLLLNNVSADDFNYYQSTSIQLSNFSYILKYPNKSDVKYDTQSIEVRHTDILSYKNLRLTSTIEASKRKHNYLSTGYFDDEYIYFKALYLEYYFNSNFSAYAGVVPYTADFLNIYSHLQEEIGEGLSLINGNIRPTSGFTYKDENFKARVGYIFSNNTLGVGPYKDIKPQSDNMTSYTYGGKYTFKKHSLEIDGYTAEFNKFDDVYTLKDNAIEYSFNDFSNSGYSLSVQYAISESSKNGKVRNGSAYNLAVKVDSDILPIYSFKYGVEYINTSKYFMSASASVVNNRANTFYKGDRATIFADFNIKKNLGFAIGYNKSHYNYIPIGYNTVYPIDVDVNSLYTSFFYHF